jgi:hypothetical protein
VRAVIITATRQQLASLNGLQLDTDGASGGRSECGLFYRCLLQQGWDDYIGAVDLHWPLPNLKAGFALT